MLSRASSALGLALLAPVLFAPTPAAAQPGAQPVDPTLPYAQGSLALRASEAAFDHRQALAACDPAAAAAARAALQRLQLEAREALEAAQAAGSLAGYTGLRQAQANYNFITWQLETAADAASSCQAPRIGTGEAFPPGQAVPPPAPPVRTETFDPWYTKLQIVDTWRDGAIRRCDTVTLEDAILHYEELKRQAQEQVTTGDPVPLTPEHANRRGADVDEHIAATRQAIAQCLLSNPRQAEPIPPPDTSERVEQPQLGPSETFNPTPPPNEDWEGPRQPAEEPPASGEQQAGWSFGLYFSAGVIWFNENGIDLGLATGTVGYSFTPNIGVEVEASIEVIDESNSSGSFSDSIGIQYMISPYVVGRVPVSDNFSLFGRVGYGVNRFATEFSSGSTSSSDSSSAWSLNLGVGGEIFLTEQSGFRLSYTRQEYDNGSESNLFGASFIHVFGSGPR